MSPLTPVRCHSCKGSVPLIAQSQVSCPYCGTQVAIPADYVAAAAARSQQIAARREAEPLWRKLSGSGYKTGIVFGASLLFTLPVVASFIAHLREPPMPQLVIFARFVGPALLPGLLIWIWAAAVGATKRSMIDAMAARPAEKEGHPPSCRECGAPLATEERALAASCAYCGTDSVLVDIAVDRERAAAEQALRTLDDANTALARRRFTVGLGSAFVTLLIGGAAVAVTIVLSTL